MRKVHLASLRVAAIAAAAMFAVTSCSTGGGSSSEEEGGGGGALPPNASSQQLRDHSISSTKGKKAAFVPVGLGTPLTEEWNRQLKRGFEAAGMEYVVRDPNWDTARQAEAVQSLINEKPDVLVVHNFDVQVLAKLIQQAEEAGIYVIQINMVSNYKSDAFVGADTIELGRRMATDIVKECGEATSTSHKVQIVQGDATSGFTLDVMAGAKEVFDQHPDIKIVSTQAANWDRTKAHDITATVIQQHPDLCASWGFWDQMQYGAATAIKEAGKIGQVKVFTSDHSAITCQALRDGLFFQSYGYSVPTQGTDIVSIAKYLLQSGKEPGSARIADFTPLVKIDRSNWDQPNMCYDGRTDGLTVS
ncbi:sugar ABC transporter substrate-binding protein [Prauserella muralis]|uniref:sugar ABC transporter substrate-binding protein n=1 Tax=Prauserella muralis TaxID=588067 RepID=UPI000DD431C3|nr:sugar ABC transporter substrate-binding protein [Prauserella muralis]TWE22368.1 monosaccharide ABC transporter substrate-binding protein (CUT2 family) [Prauserella muralis]